MVHRGCAQYLGPGKDEHGFPVDVLEDPITKQRFFAYALETWEERCRYLSELIRLKERNDGGATDEKAA